MGLGRHTAVSDTGRKRRHNEDSYVVRPPLFAVADGMGGAQAGEVASRLAVEAIADDDGAGDGEGRVAALVREANRRVYEHAGSDSATSGMGTTMTIALVENGTVAIGHVGDSRAYLVRDGMLEQLTQDHSLVAELIRSGKLSPEEAESHPQRSVITRALGTDPDVDVDTYTIESQPGDVFLLCSDGLTSMVGDAAILEAIEEHRRDLDGAARELVVRANRGGGEDNITVVFFEIAEDGAAAPEETAVPAGGGRAGARAGAGRRHARRARPRPGGEHAGVQGRGAGGGGRRGAGEEAPQPHGPRRGACAGHRRRPRGGRGDRAPRRLGPARLSAPSGSTRLLPTHDHAARCRVLSRAHSFRYGRSLRPCIAWCSRPGSGAAPPDEALMSLRNRELLNLVVVGMLTGVGFASVYIARQAEISTASLSYAAFFVALYLVAHSVARFAVPHADPYLLPIAALLTAIGITEIYRLEPTDAFRQGLWVVVGVAAFAGTLLALRRDYRVLEQYKYLFGLGAVVLLILPALPVIGRTVNGARLWVGIGPLQFQPGEFAKLFLIVFLAGYLREKREVLAGGRIKDFGPLLVIWGAAMAVLVQTNDLGSALLYFGIFLGMLYVATDRPLYAGAGLALFVAGAAAAYQVVPRVESRVSNWIDPWADAQGAGYQIIQSTYSIASGGFVGTGLGQGTFTSPGGTQLIPELKTDFIFAAIAQELGLVGAAALLLLYMVFVVRGFRTALLASDGFSKLLAAGLTFGFAVQSFIILGGILRLMPLTGITLPFVSYGGSSIVANFVLLAGLLLVSNRANALRARA